MFHFVEHILKPHIKSSAYRVMANWTLTVKWSIFTQHKTEKNIQH